MTASPKTLDRIRALLARAAHPTTPEEEARTSAVQAARLIARYDVPIGTATVVDVRVWPSPTYGPSGRGGSGLHCRYQAARSGRCQECGRAFHKGEEIGWRNPIGPVHLDC